MYRIIIADDESDIREALADLVELIDAPEELMIEISEAENGQEAFEKIQSSQYDLLITDLKMPKMEGNDLIAELSKNRELLPEHVIVVSGFISVSEEERKIDNVYFYAKPLPYEELSALIKGFMEAAV